MPDGSISGKNSLIRQLLEYDNPATRDKKITPMPNLEQRIGAAGFALAPIQPFPAGEGGSTRRGGNITLFSTVNFGAAYIAECQADSVPIPPDIGSNQWTLSTLGGNDKFPQLPFGSTADPLGNTGELFLSTGAQVYIYQSNAPEGMCIALPRSSNPGAGSSNTITLDGVICLGKTTSKVCFWDNQAPDGQGAPGPAVPFAEGTVTPAVLHVGIRQPQGRRDPAWKHCRRRTGPGADQPQPPRLPRHLLADAVVRGYRRAGCVPRVRSSACVTGRTIMADDGYRTI